MDTTTPDHADDEETSTAVAVPEFEVFQVLSGEITWDEYYAQKAA